MASNGFGGWDGLKLFTYHNGYFLDSVDLPKTFQGFTLIFPIVSSYGCRS